MRVLGGQVMSVLADDAGFHGHHHGESSQVGPSGCHDISQREREPDGHGNGERCAARSTECCPHDGHHHGEVNQAPRRMLRAASSSPRLLREVAILLKASASSGVRPMRSEESLGSGRNRVSWDSGCTAASPQATEANCKRHIEANSTKGADRTRDA